MIKVTSLKGKEFYINPEQIKKIEEISDTIITLSNGEKIRVLEEMRDVVEKIIKYRQKINRPHLEVVE